MKNSAESKHVAVIFSTVENLLVICNNFVTALEQCVSGWDKDSSVGDVFLQLKDQSDGTKRKRNGTDRNREKERGEEIREDNEPNIPSVFATDFASYAEYFGNYLTAIQTVKSLKDSKPFATLSQQAKKESDGLELVYVFFLSVFLFFCLSFLSIYLVSFFYLELCYNYLFNESFVI
jgi:hypothetical protein